MLAAPTALTTIESLRVESRTSQVRRQGMSGSVGRMSGILRWFTQFRGLLDASYDLLDRVEALEVQYGRAKR